MVIEMTLKELVKKAYEKDYSGTDDLIEIYHSTDMPDWEFAGHLKIHAEIEDMVAIKDLGIVVK